MLTGRMAAFRITAPAPPRLPTGPLAGEASAGASERWDGMDLSGSFEGVELGGPAAEQVQDLSDVTFAQCLLDGADLSGVDLARSSWQGTLARSLFADRLAAVGSTWRGAAWEGARVGSAELAQAKVAGLVIRGARLGRLDLRGATVADVLIRDAQIEDLDLDEARLTRVAFHDVRIGTLSLRGAVLKDVDLRGAMLSAVDPVAGLRGASVTAWQVAELAPLLATGLGLRVLPE